MAKPKYPEEKLLQSTFSTTDPTWMSWDWTWVLILRDQWLISVPEYSDWLYQKCFLYARCYTVCCRIMYSVLDVVIT
jgi:hypothetical protein